MHSYCRNTYTVTTHTRDERKGPVTLKNMGLRTLIEYNCWHSFWVLAGFVMLKEYSGSSWRHSVWSKIIMGMFKIIFWSSRMQRMPLSGSVRAVFEGAVCSERLMKAFYAYWEHSFRLLLLLWPLFALSSSISGVDTFCFPFLTAAFLRGMFSSNSEHHFKFSRYSYYFVQTSTYSRTVRKANGKKLAIREPFQLFGKVSESVRRVFEKNTVWCYNQMSRSSCFRKGFQEDARCMRKAFAQKYIPLHSGYSEPHWKLLLWPDHTGPNVISFVFRIGTWVFGERTDHIREAVGVF